MVRSQSVHIEKQLVSVRTSVRTPSLRTPAPRISVRETVRESSMREVRTPLFRCVIRCVMRHCVPPCPYFRCEVLCAVRDSEQWHPLISVRTLVRSWANGCNGVCNRRCNSKLQPLTAALHHDAPFSPHIRARITSPTNAACSWSASSQSLSRH